MKLNERGTNRSADTMDKVIVWVCLAIALYFLVVGW
jgi:hypothetical protein